MFLKVPDSPWITGPKGSTLQLCFSADLREILVLLNCMRPFLGHAVVSRR